MRLLKPNVQLAMFDDVEHLFLKPAGRQWPRSPSYLRFLIRQAHQVVEDLETELGATQAEFRAREQQERMA